VSAIAAACAPSSTLTLAAVVELHAAHGYFLHSCLSPLSNKRTDAYGGSFEGRTKLLLDTVRAIRSKYPNKSLWVRVSGTDFAEHVEADGQATWNGDETKKLAPLLDAEGVDVLDVSAGGLVPFQKISPKPAYQLEFAAGVKQTKPKKMLVGAVGMMEGDEYPGQVAEDALQRGDCDLILLARGMMADPAWTEHAATERECLAATAPMPSRSSLTRPSHTSVMGVRCAGSPQYHRTHPAKRPPPRAQNHN
jgi:2,4-dienoyl-CoA reductase-like NADH-dependent reductase (Old Yellow Enzyme family)